MPGAQKRLGEVNALMAAENFWNNREQAQKLIDEANSLRNKIEPLLKAEKELEDFRVMVELGEAEPEPAQAKVEQELERDLGLFAIIPELLARHQSVELAQALLRAGHVKETSADARASGWQSSVRS